MSTTSLNGVVSGVTADTMYVGSGGGRRILVGESRVTVEGPGFECTFKTADRIAVGATATVVIETA